MHSRYDRDGIPETERNLDRKVSVADLRRLFSMLGRDRGDRGALVALGLMLAAIVIVSIFGGNSASEQVRPSSWLETYAPPKDSLAQWIAALAALGSVGVSIWAVKLVRKTLSEAVESNLIARNATENQLRAYVFIESAVFDVDDSYLVLWATI
jgi:hypothetical protein